MPRAPNRHIMFASDESDMTDTFYLCNLVANVLWFGAGFWFFAIRRNTAAKLLVPRSARTSPIFLTLSSALPFLGGMNLALSLLAAMILFRRDLFVAPQEQAILLIAFGTAHATQFLINVPVAIRGGRIGKSYWDVLKGTMLFIFVVDAVLTATNFACAAALLA
jgi:hypothetical protein